MYVSTRDAHTLRTTATSATTTTPSTTNIGTGATTVQLPPPGTDGTRHLQVPENPRQHCKSPPGSPTATKYWVQEPEIMPAGSADSPPPLELDKEINKLTIQNPGKVLTLRTSSHIKSTSLFPSTVQHQQHDATLPSPITAIPPSALDSGPFSRANHQSLSNAPPAPAANHYLSTRVEHEPNRSTWRPNVGRQMPVSSQDAPPCHPHSLLFGSSSSSSTSAPNKFTSRVTISPPSASEAIALPSQTIPTCSITFSSSTSAPGNEQIQPDP